MGEFYCANGHFFVYRKNSNKHSGRLFKFTTLKVDTYSEVGACSNLHHFQLMMRLCFWRVTKEKIRSLFHFNITKRNS